MQFTGLMSLRLSLAPASLSSININNIALTDSFLWLTLTKICQFSTTWTRNYVKDAEIKLIVIKTLSNKLSMLC